MLRPILGAFQLEGEIFSLDIPSHRTRRWADFLGVAVGTIIAGRPPHRSVRALLRIRLPPRVTGVKALHRVGMKNARYWNPSVYDPVKPFHGDPAALAAPR